MNTFILFWQARQMQDFQRDAKEWLRENCPPELLGRHDAVAYGGTKLKIEGPSKVYFDRMVERGWTVPDWPVKYGGAGLDHVAHKALLSAMVEVGAPLPLTGMGITMIGPTLLEFGTEEQKARHLPSIAKGETLWCQGYSEPAAGSDLASLKTRAEDQGDHFLINGSKLWTSGAQFADWMFCLVRTDTQAPKHDGISFVLLPMDQPGVSVRPIKLISGNSSFCECFFDNARAEKCDLVGRPNHGWGIGKRLLQYERSSLSSRRSDPESVPDIARRYLSLSNGRISDQGARAEVIDYELDRAAFVLTQRRAKEENAEGGTPTYATSIFKLVSSELAVRRSELIVSLLGNQGLGWSGDAFTKTELAQTRMMLAIKAGTIAGGSSEIQRNIIAKRVLGLPD